MDTHVSAAQDSSRAALAALQHGYVAIPIRDGHKAPYEARWTQTHWDPHDTAPLLEKFAEARSNGAHGVGLLLGEPSGGLVDIDLDYPKSVLLRDHLLPHTAMRTGRPGHPGSHLWFRVEGEPPGTRRHKMPDGSTSIEFRCASSQTVIPPSTWYPKHWDGKASSTEQYRWEGEPWGGEAGPALVSARQLIVDVATVALGCVLIDHWPAEGGRHDAYLALAGALLRFGYAGVHPFWEKNLPVLISALASATRDADGPETRVKEVMSTTLARLRSGDKVTGMTALTEIIGPDHAIQVKRLSQEVEQSAGFTVPSLIEVVGQPSDDGSFEELEEAASSQISGVPLSQRDPLAERGDATWQHVDLDPYLAGEVRMPEPTVLRRDDGQALMYQGRVNMLFGKSESAKSWIATLACVQEMGLGSRVLYIDLEDEPAGTLARLKLLGVADDDVRHAFTYIRPEDPIEEMQKNRWGQLTVNDQGRKNSLLFKRELDRIEPSLIVVDGMTVLYGLHALDTNDSTSTDIISTWLKKLTRNGRSTVIVIDHTAKGSGKGDMPIGSQHKVAMVQGTALQVYPITQPMPGELGEVELVVCKDRPGAVRAASTKKGGPQVAAAVQIDSRVAGVTSMTLSVPDPDETVIGDDDAADRLLRFMAALGDDIVALLRESVPMSGNEIKLALPGGPPDKRVDESLKLLIGEGRIVHNGVVGRYSRYSLPDV